MKKYLLILCVIVAGLSSCKKDDTETYNAAAHAIEDDGIIRAYLAANNITAVHDPSGLYYRVVTPGNGVYPTSGSTVVVDYTGRFLNGTVFDSQAAYSASLSTGVILGWTIGVPHIDTGGTIELYVPSTMAYRDGTTGSIPPNTVLNFTIKLVSIK